MFVYLKKPETAAGYAQAAIKIIAACALFAWASGCTPAFNWREVAFDGQPVTALLPCKPDRGARQVVLAGAPREMVMAGCEAGGAMFTIAVIDVQEVQKLAAAEKELRAVNKATHSQYAQHGSVLVQAAVYGQPNASRDGPGALSTEAIETFFTGLKMPTKP